MHTCLLIIPRFMTFGHSKLVRQQKWNYQLGVPSPLNRPFLLHRPCRVSHRPQGGGTAHFENHWCRLMCTGTPEDGGMAGAFIPLSFQKGSNGGGQMPFHYKLGAWEFLVWRMIFSRISPNFHEKFFVQLLSTSSLPRRSWRLFGVTSKKGLHVIFCKPWAPCFEVKQG